MRNDYNKINNKKVREKNGINKKYNPKNAGIHIHANIFTRYSGHILFTRDIANNPMIQQIEVFVNKKLDVVSFYAASLI